MELFHKILKACVDSHASDIHSKVGHPTVFRISRQLVAIDAPSPTTEWFEKVLENIVPKHLKDTLQKTRESDFSYFEPDIGRFRTNIFQQSGQWALAMRHVKSRVPHFEELGLHPVCRTLAESPRGIILLAGTTGSGKSTTLAAMIDQINTERRCHILTIEDPIEYLHAHKNCLVNQREVHADTQSFSNALRAALREDPDIVLIGEMRDLETVEAALKIAETGHLTFATLHTNSASSTINRIIDVFPAHQQSQIRTQLSLVLEGIVCQSLLPKANGQGRTVALEILIPTPGIRNLIREDKVHQIYSAMQTGQEKVGMQTMNQSLASLHLKRVISLETAMGASSLREELQEMINRGVGVVPGAGLGRATPPARPMAR